VLADDTLVPGERAELGMTTYEMFVQAMSQR